MSYFDIIRNGLEDFPVISAFLLGLFVAINPCSLAANISALGLLSYNDEEEKTNESNRLKTGLLFILGKSVAYFVLAVILYLFADLLDFGNSVQQLYGKLLGIFFILAGILMLDIIHIHGAEKKVLKVFKNKNAFIIGVLLAYAFCPDGGIMYFGMMIPISINVESPVIIPLVFTIGSAIPMIILSLIISKSMAKVGNIKVKINGLYEIIRKFFGVVFIIVGTWFVAENFFHDHEEHEHHQTKEATNDIDHKS